MTSSHKRNKRRVGSVTPLGDGRVFHVYSFAHQSAKPVPADRLSRLAEVAGNRAFRPFPWHRRIAADRETTDRWAQHPVVHPGTYSIRFPTDRRMLNSPFYYQFN